MITSVFPKLRLRERELLPVIQGGMGVGVSAHRLAGSVAREGAVGTIASVELRRLHPDIMQRTQGCRDHEVLAASNLEALDRELGLARELAGSQGFIAVNVMRAVKHYAELTLQACKSGADAIIMGAGLPFELPDLVKAFPKVALLPILSEERGVRAVLKRWLRKGAKPDGIILEHPRYAGGHLGATRLQEVGDGKYDFALIVPRIQEVFVELGLAVDEIPLILAGGVNSHASVQQAFALGASGVQVGTAFAVTEEGDAHINFKKVLAGAKPEDIITFMSTAGLPARAVLTPWLKKYLAREPALKARANPETANCPRHLECLSHCGFKDGNAAVGQFCIETQLAAAQRGDVQRGLFFRGSEALPFGEAIVPVRALLQLLLSGEVSSFCAAGVAA